MTVPAPALREQQDQLWAMPRRYSMLDWGSAVLWLMAVATVMGAALWAGRDLKYSVKVEGILPGDEVRLTPPAFLCQASKYAP